MRYRFPVSRRWSPQANPTARHQRTLRDHVIRVGAPRYRPVFFLAFAATKLYCLVTEAVGCEQLAYGCCAAASQPGLELVTLRSQVRRPTTKPPRHPRVSWAVMLNRIGIWKHLMWMSRKIQPIFSSAWLPMNSISHVVMRDQVITDSKWEVTSFLSVNTTFVTLSDLWRSSSCAYYLHLISQKNCGLINIRFIHLLYKIQMTKRSCK